MNSSLNKYFLAANSAEGFVSHFGDCYNPFDNWKAYIIKGGPGTGKSSFMRYIAKKGEEKGLIVEYFPCSSDPSSLDAVAFPETKTVIMDGTDPHIVNPKFIGICENLLDIGVFWDENKLTQNAEKIIDLTLKNKSSHKKASNYIKTAGNLIRWDFETAVDFSDCEKIDSFTEKLIKKHIPKGEDKGYEWIRFLGGITPDGIVSFRGTEYKNIEIIEDKYGAVSSRIFRKIRDYSLNNGYEIITIKNPFLPSLIIDGIIIPKLSVAFFREYKFMKMNLDIRRIRYQRFLKKNLDIKGSTFKFNQKITDSLLSKAVESLNYAKSVHDELEKCYIGAMDFDALSRFAEEFAEKALKLN